MATGTTEQRPDGMTPAWRLRGSVRRAWLLTVILAAAVASGVQAAVLPLSVEELTHRSKHVVVGEVVQTQSYFGPFGGLSGAYGRVIWTDVTVRVEHYIKGKIDAKDLTVLVLGGQVGTAIQRCPESPVYRKGEKVLLFLHELSRNTFAADGRRLGKLWTTGWFQGKYRLSGSSSGADEVTVEGKGTLPIVRKLSLSKVETQIRLYMRTEPRTKSSTGTGSFRIRKGESR